MMVEARPDAARGPRSPRSITAASLCGCLLPARHQDHRALRAVDQVVADAAQYQLAQCVESPATGHDELSRLAIGNVQQDVSGPASGQDGAVRDAGFGQGRAPVLLETP